jgi:hypothetical protein
MSEYDDIDSDIRWMREDVGELFDRVSKLEVKSHPQVPFVECPKCFAICFEVEGEDGLTGYDKHMSWHTRNVLIGMI